MAEYSKVGKRLFQVVRFRKWGKHIEFSGKVCWKASTWKELLQ